MKEIKVEENMKVNKLLYTTLPLLQVTYTKTSVEKNRKPCNNMINQNNTNQFRFVTRADSPLVSDKKKRGNI